MAFAGGRIALSAGVAAALNVTDTDNLPGQSLSQWRPETA